MNAQRAYLRLALLGCLFWRLPAPVAFVDRHPLYERLELRLGIPVTRDLFTPGPRDLMTTSEQPAASIDFNRQVFGEKIDPESFVKIPLAREEAVTFAADTDWSVFEGRREPGTIATALAPRELAGAVAESYNLALTRAYGRRPGVPTREGEAGLNVKKITKGDLTEFRDEATGDLLYAMQTVSVDTPLGPESFSRAIVPMPKEIAVVGRDWRYTTTRELALTLDAQGRILGVEPHLGDGREKSARLALAYLGKRADTRAELVRRQNLQAEIDRELAKLRTHERTYARWETSREAQETVARLRREGVSDRAPFVAHWSTTVMGRNLRDAGLYATGAAFPPALVVSIATGSLVVGSAVGAFFGAGVGALSFVFPMLAANNPATLPAGAARDRVQSLAVLRNRIAAREAELKRLTTDHRVFEVAQAENDRQKENQRNLLDPVLGRGPVVSQWAPSQHVFQLYDERERGAMNAAEYANMLSLFRRAEALPLSDPQRRRLVADLPSGSGYDAGYARADKVLRDWEAKSRR